MTGFYMKCNIRLKWIKVKEKRAEEEMGQDIQE